MKPIQYISILGLVLCFLGQGLQAQTTTAAPVQSSHSLSLSSAMHEHGVDGLVVVDSLKADTLSLPTDSIPVSYTSLLPSDSVVKRLPEGPKRKKKKNNNFSIEDDIQYNARDSIVMEGTKIAILYGDATVTYQAMELKADFIRVNLDSNIVFATGTVDTLGNMKGAPVFKDGGESFESKAMRYNMKTKKGFIYGTVTEQGEGYVTSQKTKKVGDDVYCLQNGKYTTCNNHDHPHFYLALTKAKMKQGKYIVTGPAYLVVEDIPLPIAVPFGYFPINQKYNSGILFPNIGEEQTRGFFLKGLGYYFAINDYLDLAITADIYTKGSWSLAMASSYKWRYKFSGSFNMSYVSNVYGQPNTPDYRRTHDFRLMWSHRQDPKLSPYTSFSASVNFSTSSYEQNNIDSYYNPNEVAQNTKSSTITLTQKLGDSPWTLSASMYVNQRTSDSTINLQIPTLNLNMSRVYPFKKKKAMGKEKWYEKFALSYRFDFTNGVTAKESEFAHMDYKRDWDYGMKHDLPISASFTLFKYLNLNFNWNNNLKWYFQRIDQNWQGDVNGAVVRDTTYGFYNIYNSNISIGLQTQLFGFYKIKKKDGRGPIFRHKLVPSVSISYASDFGSEIWGYWGHYDRPTSDGKFQTVYYDRFANGVYGGSPSRGYKGVISFMVANNLEMKYWSKRDSTGKPKKMTIIDNFSFGSAYNFMADSLNWSTINLNLRLKFFDQFSLNIDFILDPYTYELNSFGSPVRVNRSQIEKNHVLGRLMQTGTSFGYTFSNATFKRKKKKTETAVKPAEESELERKLNQADPLRKIEDRAVKKPKDREGYAEFKIPWSLTLNYSVRYAYDKFNTEIMEYDRKLTHNLSISGRINFTPTWSFSVSSYYDITNNEWSYVNCTLSKDLHCWQMSCSFVPVGRYSTYNFMIGVKSDLLKDLKYEKESDMSDQINWY